MIPSKCNSSDSRHSSILKPPKPRQPLQNVNFNSSSNESSPATSKLKRRVSFAEKKQVKEFCDSLEQGTVWDNTYEEHDLSNVKLPCCLSQSLTSKENINCTDVSVNHIQVECDTVQNDIELSVPNSNGGTNTLNCELDLTDPVDHLGGTEISQKEEIILANLSCTSLSQSMSEMTNEHFPLCLPNAYASNNITVYMDKEIDETCIQNNSMDFTMAVPVVMCSALSHNLHDKENHICQSACQNISMEIVEGTTTEKKLKSHIMHQQLVGTNKNSQETIMKNEEQADVSHVKSLNSDVEINKDVDMALNENKGVEDMDISMEFTEVIPSIIKLNKNPPSRDDRTKIFQNESMEITTALRHNVQQEFDCTAKISNKTIIFHDVSMEVTKGVKSIPHNKTNAICNTNKENIDIEICTDEKTRVLNASMEITEAVASLSCTEKDKTSVILPYNDISNNQENVIQSRVCHNETMRESMDFTSAILSLPMSDRLKNTLKQTDENVEENVQKGFNETEESAKTQIYQNQSMMITEVVPSIKVNNNSENLQERISDKNLNECDPLYDTTKLFQNMSMEVTSAISNYITPTAAIIPSEKTLKNSGTILNSPSISMEITAAASLLSNDVIYSRASSKENRAHSTMKLIENSQDAEENNMQCPVEKTFTFLDDSLEELQSIKPPSFIYRDSISENSFANAIYEDVIKNKDTIENHENISENDVLNKDKIHSTNMKLRHRSETYIVKPKDSNIDIGGLNTDCEEVQINSVVNIEPIEQTDFETQDTEIPTAECLVVLIDSFNKNSTIPIENNNEESEKNQTGNYSLTENLNIYRSDSVQDIQNDIINQNNEHPNQELKETMEICEEKNIVFNEDPFSALLAELKTFSKRDDCIWSVYHENYEKKKFVIGFISNSLLVGITILDDEEDTTTHIIKNVKTVSRLSDDNETLITIVHRLILEKVNAEDLLYLYRSYEDVLPMLDHISQEVKHAMDFMFDLRRLNNLNLMEITPDRISFISRSKRLDIILRVTINIKPFEKITPNDISICCLLGTVRDKHVKELVRNVKRDGKFLRRYMNDVTDYIDLMEESTFISK